jgi:alkylhydroperoxidase/carboxymuconolactone decarboxylase family protein YurZ
VTPVQPREIVDQAVPYVGIANVFDFLPVTNEVRTERGAQLRWPSQSITTPDTRLDTNLAAQKHIVGADRVDTRYANARNDEQHIQRYLSANCFGDHLTRDGIALETRELLTFAMRVGLGGCELQIARPRRREPQRRQQPRAVVLTPVDPVHRSASVPPSSNRAGRSPSSAMAAPRVAELMPEYDAHSISVTTASRSVGATAKRCSHDLAGAALPLADSTARHGRNDHGLFDPGALTAATDRSPTPARLAPIMRGCSWRYRHACGSAAGGTSPDPSGRLG